jgi:hypothetical protein
MYIDNLKGVRLRHDYLHFHVKRRVEKHGTYMKVLKLKYLVKTVGNKNLIHEVIESRLNSLNHLIS